MPADSPTVLATTMGFNRARCPWQPSPVFDYAFDIAGRPRHPRLCLLSTGTGDSRANIDAFYSAFEDRAVRCSHLCLFDKPNVPDVRAHLLQQDVIWVDRGSVVNLLAVWRAHRLDAILRECWERGVVLAGESAGSLCWFRGGITDSFGELRAFGDGLGFLPFANAVHYSDRHGAFLALLKSGPFEEGFATDVGAGLHFSGTRLVAAISDRPYAGAYRLCCRQDGAVVEEPLLVTRLARAA